MNRSLTSADAFRAYLKDIDRVSVELFHAVVEKGDIQLLEILLTRDICISPEMFKPISPGVIKDMVHAYRRDWTLYYMALSGTEIDIDDHENVDFGRIIEGKTIAQYIKESSPDDMTESDEDTEYDHEDLYFTSYMSPQDEAKREENGRLRIYQRRPGSLYCGLYAIQHVLDNVDDVKQSDLDELSHHVVDGIELSVEAKQEITRQDHVDANGNYSMDTLCQALENNGYVTSRHHHSRPNVTLLQDANVFGIIANRSRSHWFAFRRVGDQWEECDSLASAPFPMRTFQEVSTRTFEAYIAVIRPTPLPDSIDWMDQSQRARVAQLFEMVKRNQ